MDDTANARSAIEAMARQGFAMIPRVEAEANVAAAEALARRAIGWLDAANALLNAFAELHNEMVELPEFVALRRFARSHR
jgi:hypothetical protein